MNLPEITGYDTYIWHLGC